MKHYGGNAKPEPLDPTPMEIPLGACQPESLEQLVAKYMRIQIEQEKGEEFESFEDANDFEEEDPDTLWLDTRYTLQEVEPEAIDPGYDPEKPPQAAQEAPQEEIGTQEGSTPRSHEETPSGASE